MRAVTRPHALTAMVAAAMVALSVVGAQPVQTASRVLIWPLDPTIEASQQASPLWLENQGHQPVTLQIRVMRWTVRDYVDHLDDEQTAVIASPPLATIEPGKRQLVRLVRTDAAEPGRQQAFRVLIDELPSVTSTDRPLVTHAASMGVSFRFRYSVPLFSYGRGLNRSQAQALPATAALAWRVVTEGNQRWLQIRNTGSTHARLSRVRVSSAEGDADVAQGLLGYVLPGTERRWSWPTTAAPSGTADLFAEVNGRIVGPFAKY